MSGETTFTATEADYVAANRLWHAKAGRQRLLFWAGFAALVLGAGNIILQLARGKTASEALGDAAAILLFAVIILGMRLLTVTSIPRQVRRMMAQNVALNDPIACAWDHEAIRFSGSNGTADLAWRRLHRWIEDDTSFVFLQSDRLMHTVPKRALTDAQQIDLHSTAAESGVQRW